MEKKVDLFTISFMRGISEYATYVADSVGCARPTTTFCKENGTAGLGIQYNGHTYEIRIMTGTLPKYPEEFTAEVQEALDEAMLGYAERIEALYIAFVGACSDVEDEVLRFTYIEYSPDQDLFLTKYTDPGFLKTILKATQDDYEPAPANSERENMIVQRLSEMKPLRFVVVKVA